MKHCKNDIALKPKHRSPARLLLGKMYYKFKRYLWWWFSGNQLSKRNKSSNTNANRYLYATHQSPLIRSLKDVDMYLQYNKIKNLKLAVQKINHVVINPGEIFSFWKLVGKPTKQKGYLDGMILFCGTVKPGIGGGLCQLTNLIYWMALHTPLTVIERYRHSFDVFPDSNRTQPFGSGATCIYNYRDLMIKNETNHPFELILEVTETDLVGAFRSNIPPSFHYDVYEKDHRMDQEYWGGYSRHNSLYRKVYDIEGIEVADEFIIDNHALMMYQPFIEMRE
ncbi:MAG: VanW family protein [Mobilitalea sp.]